MKPEEVFAALVELLQKGIVVEPMPKWVGYGFKTEGWLIRLPTDKEQEIAPEITETNASGRTW